MLHSAASDLNVHCFLDMSVLILRVTMYKFFAKEIKRPTAVDIASMKDIF